MRLPVAQRVSGEASSKPSSLASGGTTVAAASASTICVRANGHGGRYCRSRCARLCQYSFTGGRLGSSSGRGRHVVRRRRGCLKDGLAEAAAAAAGGGGSDGSGSLEPSPLSVRPVPW